MKYVDIRTAKCDNVVVRIDVEVDYADGARLGSLHVFCRLGSLVHLEEPSNLCATEAHADGLPRSLSSLVDEITGHATEANCALGDDQDRHELAPDHGVDKSH